MASLKRIVPVLLCCGLFFSGFSQDTTLWFKNTLATADTQRVSAYLALSEYYMRKDFTRATAWADTAETIAKRAGFLKGEAGAYKYKGEINYREGDFKDALMWFGKAFEIYSKLNDKQGIGETINHIGTVYFKQGNNEEAITKFIEARILFEGSNYKDGLTSTYINIGLVYDNLKDYEKALQFYKKAITYGTEVGDENSIASCYNNMGGIYTDIKQYDLALECLERSLKLKEKLGNKAGIAGTLNNMGAILYEKGDLKKALEYFIKAFGIKESIGDKNGMISSLNNIGYMYTETGEYVKAEEYLGRALKLAQEVGSKSLGMDCTEGLVDLFKKTGDYKKALQYHEMFLAYKDSLFDTEKTKNVVEIQTKFESEKKQQENEILNLQLKNESFVKYIYGAVAIVLFIAVFFIFRSFRQKQKANLVLEDKNRIIEQQKHIVEEQNKDITDSIKYAERIQQAIFPPDKMWHAILPDSFVFFRPKDILSGDFYWVEQRGDLIFVAAADCTGHGVPGALMSIVNYNLLNKAVLEMNLTDPAEILNAVNNWLTLSLHQTYQESTVRDGMDISLCVINKKTSELTYSGANNPVYIFRNKELLQLNADKFPVGAFVEDNIQSFTNQKLQLGKGDTIYLFSDGYADQFGGPKGKKLKYINLKRYLTESYEMSMRDQERYIEAKFTDWKGNYEQIDDVLVIGIRL